MVVSQLISAVVAVLLGFTLIAAARTIITIATQSVRLLLILGLSLLLAQSAFPKDADEYRNRLPSGIAELVTQAQEFRMSLITSWVEPAVTAIAKGVENAGAHHRRSNDRRTADVRVRDVHFTDDAEQ